MQLKVIKQNCKRIVSFNIIIKMQNANLMKPINVTKQSDLQPNITKLNNIQTVNNLPLTKPQSYIKRVNKNLLEKYSFQENDLSKSQEDISMNDDIYPLTKQNDNDWLQLSVKQITLFSRQLIVIFLYFIRQTFYLQIQYTIIYNQIPNQQILSSLQNSKNQTKNNKNQLNEKNTSKQNDLLDYNEVRYVKSKLVHGSILQNEGKHLILSLKAKNVSSLKNSKHVNQGLKLLKLSEIQFSLIRVYQTSKQGKILCRQVIPNPIVNKEYSIDFWQEKSDFTQKQKPIGTMLFELFSAITEEPLAKKIYEQQAQSLYYIGDDSQIPQDISENKNSARVVGYQNYTLGVPRKQQKENSRNVFDDNQSQQDMSQLQPNSHRSRPNNQSQSNNQRFKYQSQVSQTKENALIYKLNEMTRIGDDNLSKSKNEGYSQRQYLAQTTQLLQEINDKTNSRSKDNKKVINMNDTSNINDTKLSRTKQKHVIKTQNDYTYVENDTQSRFQGNTTTNQRQQYQSTLQYSKYVNQQIVLKGSPEISPITPSTPTNNFQKRSENKVKQVQTSKTTKFQRNKNNLQQKITKEKQVTLSKNIKQSNRVSPYSQRVQNDQQEISQDNSQWLLQNLPDMDSSNIRYKFDDNDISNIEETKNMQQLINQIQKIEKQWYQKRVLNRQSNQKLKVDKSQNKNNKNIQEKKMRQQSRQENKNNCIDLELRKFKIKLDENTFYNKLIENLKNKHKINHTQSKIDQQKAELTQNNKKDEPNNKLPKDYIVYLIAHEVKEEQMSSPSSQISQKIHIKIPLQKIQDLIQTEKIQSEQSIPTKDQNILPKPKSDEPSNIITSQNIRKKIIKDFQKQLFSKVMKIKLINPKQKFIQNNHISQKQKNKNLIPEKSKTKIIQIALEQEYSLLSGELNSVQKHKNQDPNKKYVKDLKNSNINENRISLIGMYPLPVMRPQNKGQQASFYQNIPNEPLSITMYNMKTGTQQGRLCFEMKKGKIDKEIQTFESLDDLSQNKITQKRTKSQLKSYNNLSAKIQEKQKSLKSNSNNVKAQKSNVNTQAKTSKEKQLKIDFNLQSNKQQNPYSLLTKKQNNEIQINNKNKQSLVNNQPQKLQKQSKPLQKQKQGQQNKDYKLTLNGPQIKKSTNKNYQLQIQINNQKPQKDNNLDIRQNIKSTLQKQKQVNQRLFSPHAGKIIKNTGQQLSPKRGKTQGIQNQQGGMGKLNLQNNIDRKGFTQRLNNISVNLPQSQRLLHPLINTQEQKRQHQSPTQLKTSKDKTSKNSNRIKTEENPRIYINSKNKLYQDRNQQGSSSYRLMKKQLQETAGLLENLKMKAQDFINKVERQKRSETKNSRLEQTQSVKQKPNKFSNSQNDNSQIDKKQFSERQRKASQLQVRSSVISQTVLSNKNKKINQIQNHNKLLAGNNQNKINRDLNKNSNGNEYQEQETPYITQKNSGDSRMLKDRIKKSIKLKQAGDYQFDTLSYDLNKGHNSRKTNQTPIKAIKGQTFSKEEKKLISVEFYSMKIKFLEVSNPQNKKSKKSKLNNSQDYFVKIYSDTTKNKERSKQSLSSYKQSAPFIQRCYKSHQLTNDNLYVQFPLIKSKDSQKKPTLCLQGKESSHIIIHLYKNLQQHLKQQMKKNYQSYLNHDQHHIDLITSSPKNNPNSQPIGTLQVTFLQLMAQDSVQFKTENDLRHKKSTIINYSNFLYSGQKIIGKININYAVNSRQKNDNQIHKKRNSYEQPHVFLNLHGSMPRQSFISAYQNQNPSQINQFYNKHETIEQNMSNISTFKNTNQLKIKNSLLARYNENLSLFERDHEEIRKLRSQSGMTKKVSPRRKKIKRNNIPQTDKNSQQSRLVDPLQILKRRGPKPLKSSQKIKSHSQSHHVRLSRPFQTPMNKRAKNHLDSLNSSSSLHFNRQKTTENHSQVKNSGISSNQVQIYPGKFLQTSQRSQQQIIQHKKDKSSQIRRKKNTKELKSYNIQSRIYPTEQTRLSQMRKYDGGNIKFGKSSRFNIVDSPQNPINSEKADFPGPGHYEVRSIFDRHTTKEP